MTVSYDDIVGPYLSEGQAAAVLRVPADELRGHVASGTVLGLKTVEGTVMFPAFQFEGAGALPFLAEVLRHFDGRRLDAALWLVQPSRDLDGASPAQALRGDDTAFVLELARRVGEVFRS